MEGQQPKKSANPGRRVRPGRPRDREVDAAVATYAVRCADLLPHGSDPSPTYTAGVRHAALETALEASRHPGLRSAVISRCRRDGIPLPPRGRPSAEAAAVEAVLVAVWRFEEDLAGNTRVVILGERWRRLSPEQATPAQLLVWRERARVRRMNALPPAARREAILRLAAASRPPRSTPVRRPAAS